MKKVLKISAIVLAAILVLLIVLPFAFKGKIKEAIVRQGNQMIDARFDFGGLSLSLLRHFPSASASLRDFYIVGNGRFEKDTLVRVGRLTVAFDLSSLWGDDGYDISKIALDDAHLNAIVLEDSTANWDIMKPSEEEGSPDAESPGDFRIKLRNLTVNNLSLSYDDRVGKVFASVAGLDATLSGDLSAAHSTLRLTADASGIVARAAGVAWLNGADFSVRTDVDADLENNRYTLRGNTLRLNAIEASIEGWVALLDDDATDMDLTFSTPKIEFKDILSLVPAIYAKDFASVKASGQVSLQGAAKGVMKGDDLPSFEVGMKVVDGTFRYPDLPKGVDGINITASAVNPGGSADLTKVEVNPLSFTIAGNPFSMKASVSSPLSDPAFQASAHGVIDLGMIGEVYPLDSVSLKGVVKADASVEGRMSYIEKEQYDLIATSGSVTLTGMLLKTAGNPDVDIKRSTLTFSPRYLSLSETSVLIGRNDMTLDCRVENYMGYALKDQTLRGVMNLSSSYLNLSDLMGPETATAEEGESAPMSVIEVPRNLDLSVNAALKKVVFDGLEIDDMSGRITVKDARADLSNLSMNTLGGAVKMNGYYSTAKSVENPDLSADLAMSGLSFSRTFKEFVTIQKIAPLFEKLNGNYSGTMKLTTQLDKELSPVLATMNGAGSISTKDVSLSEIGVVSQILDLAKIGGITDKKVKDMKVDFTIEEGKVKTKPFDIKLGQAAINLSGVTSLDQSIDYVGKVQLPPAAAALLGGAVQSVNLKIGGTFTSPKVSLDMKNIASQATQTAVNTALDQVGKKLGIDLSDAQKQRDELIAAAQKAAQNMMSEVQKQNDALVAKANNPLAKIAAQTAATAAFNAAQKQADALVAKATAKGDSIVARAKQ